MSEQALQLERLVDDQEIRRGTNMSSEFFVEAVAYQQTAIEEMERRAFAVEAMHPIKESARDFVLRRAISRWAR